jgi:four helix bundle protein
MGNTGTCAAEDARWRVAKITSFRDLQAWQLAMDTVDRTYDLLLTFPIEERFELAGQIRRAAVSVPSNIAEGHSRRSLRSYLNHIGIALGSLGELDTEIEIAERRGYCSHASAATVRDQLDRTRQVVHGLRRSLEFRLLGSLGAVAACILVLTPVVS